MTYSTQQPKPKRFRCFGEFLAKTHQHALRRRGEPPVCKSRNRDLCDSELDSGNRMRFLSSSFISIKSSEQIMSRTWQHYFQEKQLRDKKRIATMILGSVSFVVFPLFDGDNSLVTSTSP